MKSPLSQAQTSIYYACETSVTDELNYQNSELFALPGSVDTGRLQRAVRDVLEAHPYIFSRIELNEEGQPCMAAGKKPEDTCFVPVREVSRVEWEDVQKTFSRTMDIHGERLYRAEIYKVTGEGNYLYLDLHHVISDGYSMMALSRDISLAYNGQPLTAETMDGAAVAEATLW